jgi:hypothetical protein
VLGGRPSRLLDVELRGGLLVAGSLAIQIVLFARTGAHLPDGVRAPAHLASYALLVAFALRNRRLRGLWLVCAGMALNLLVIAANGGRMPLLASAAHAAGLAPTGYANVSVDAHRLWFLGDVFALPQTMPFATVVSPGDVLIALGAIAFVVVASADPASGATLDVGRLLGPLRVQPYRRLATARFVSYLGDWLTIAAVVGWMYGTTGSTAAVAGVMLVRVAPPIVGGGVAAMVVDRLPRRGLLVVLELARALCIAGVLSAVLGDSRIGVLVFLAFAGVLTAVSNAATAALVPALLAGNQLAGANALLALLKDAAMALGAGGAGVALALGSATPALLVDLTTFAAAAILLRGLVAMPRPRTSSRAFDGVRYLARRRLILLLVAAFSTATVATGLVNATLPSLLSLRGLGEGGYGFGMASLAAGAAVGEAIVGLSRVAPSADRWIGCGLLAMALLFAALAVVPSGATAMLFLALIGCVDGTTDVVYSTVLQRESDDSFLGAVFGFSTSMMTTTMVVAFALAPACASLVGSAGVVAVAATVLAAGGVVALAAVRGTHPRTRAVPAHYTIVS